jgi:hypothetical protein
MPSVHLQMKISNLLLIHAREMMPDNRVQAASRRKRRIDGRAHS